jgi:hypothetical protein
MIGSVSCFFASFFFSSLLFSFPIRSLVLKVGATALVSGNYEPALVAVVVEALQESEWQEAVQMYWPLYVQAHALQDVQFSLPTPSAATI